MCVHAHARSRTHDWPGHEDAQAQTPATTPSLKGTPKGFSATAQKVRMLWIHVWVGQVAYSAVHTCIHYACIHACIHTHAQDEGVHVRVCFECIHEVVCTSMYVCAHAIVHAYTSMKWCSRTLFHACVCTSTCIQTYTNLCNYIRVHTHFHARTSINTYSRLCAHQHAAETRHTKIPRSPEDPGYRLKVALCSSTCSTNVIESIKGHRQFCSFGPAYRYPRRSRNRRQSGDFKKR